MGPTERAPSSAAATGPAYRLSRQAIRRSRRNPAGHGRQAARAGQSTTSRNVFMPDDSAMCSARFGVFPVVIQTAQAKLAGRAFDEEIAFDGVEQAHSLWVERVRAHRVFAGQERQRGKFEAKGVVLVVEPCRLVS